MPQMPQPVLPYCPFAGQREPTDEEISALFDPWQCWLGIGAFRKAFEAIYKWVHRLTRDGYSHPPRFVAANPIIYLFYDSAQSFTSSPLPPAYEYYRCYYYDAVQNPTSWTPCPTRK